MDPGTWRQVSGSIHEANQQGLDPAEELWHRGLVLDESVRVRLRIQAVNGVLGLLDNWKPAEVLLKRVKDGRPGTPTDMYQAVVQFIEEYRDSLKE